MLSAAGHVDETPIMQLTERQRQLLAVNPLVVTPVGQTHDIFVGSKKGIRQADLRLVEQVIATFNRALSALLRPPQHPALPRLAALSTWSDPHLTETYCSIISDERNPHVRRVAAIWYRVVQARLGPRVWDDPIDPTCQTFKESLGPAPDVSGELEAAEVGYGPGQCVAMFTGVVGARENVRLDNDGMDRVGPLAPAARAALTRINEYLRNIGRAIQPRRVNDLVCRGRDHRALPGPPAALDALLPPPTVQFIRAWLDLENRAIDHSRAISQGVGDVEVYTVAHPIHLITTPSGLADAIDAMYAEAGRPPVLGFDAEWGPTTKHRADVIQLATSTVAWVIQVRIAVDPTTGPALARLLESAILVGVGVEGDLRRVRAIPHTPLDPAQCTIRDVAEMARGRGHLDAWSLQGTVQAVLGRRMLKDEGLRCFEWGRHGIPEAQLRYAAHDAWAGIHVLMALEGND